MLKEIERPNVFNSLLGARVSNGINRVTPMG
jgi:hypothetical protein